MNPADDAFKLPDDGYFQIECNGIHPNARAGITQVIDDEAKQSIVKNFNSAADADPNFGGMLVDTDHFKHDEDKPTIASGWLMRLQNRADGIYGLIRWTVNGKKAVRGGDWKYFSTEYLTKDFTVINGSQKPRQMRPIRLAGLTLTNVPNNKGQKPISNRDPVVHQPRSPQHMQSLILNRQPETSSTPADDRAMNRATLMASLRTQYPGRPFAWIWNMARQQCPSYFDHYATAGASNREVLATAETVRNRQTEDAAMAELIRDAIDKVRAENKELNYGQARAIARRRDPKAFGE